jgi:hypothetical protein
LQGIAHQQRGGFIELNVAGRFAAPQIVVVHARHVVMRQRIDMNQLDRAGGMFDPGWIGADRLAGRESQHRTNPLAAAQRGIAHGGMELFRRDHGLRQDPGQGGLHARLHCARPGREIRLCH